MNSDKYIIEQLVIKKNRTTNILQRKNYSGQFYTNGKAN
jgi:hypothetical protein